MNRFFRSAFGTIHKYPWSQNLLRVKDLIQDLPPPWSICTTDSSGDRTFLKPIILGQLVSVLRWPMLCPFYLHSVCHSPPLSDFGVCSHGFHISLKVTTDIFECCKQCPVVVEED